MFSYFPSDSLSGGVSAGRARRGGRGVPVAAVRAGRQGRDRRGAPAAHGQRAQQAARVRLDHGQGAGRDQVLAALAASRCLDLYL